MLLPGPRDHDGPRRGAGPADDPRAGQAAADGPQRGRATPPTSCSGSPRRPSASTARRSRRARADQRFTGAAPAGRAWSAAITPWNYPISMITRKVGPAARRRAAPSCSSPPSRRRCAPSRCSRSSTRPACPPAWSTWSPPTRPAPVGDELLANPAVRKLTFTGSTEVGKMLAARAAGDDEAGLAGARRARAVHRLRRRRPGPRRQGRRPGQVPQHRPGVHLPEPDLRAPLDRRRVRRRPRRAGSPS